MRFLIDECLTVDLVGVASRAGYEAQHVAYVGKGGWKDWNAARYASDGDFVLVTNNAGDFRRLYGSQPLHAGLVIIIPNINRLAQARLFAAPSLSDSRPAIHIRTLFLSTGLQAYLRRLVVRDCWQRLVRLRRPMRRARRLRIG